MKLFLRRTGSYRRLIACFAFGACCMGLLLWAGPSSAAILYVDSKASGDESGNNWNNALTSLAVALDVVSADSGDEIWVAEGTYKPTEDGDRMVSFVLKSGVALYGGFAGTESSQEERDPSAHRTILTGDLGVEGDMSDNSYHVVTSEGLDDTAVLDSFTVTGGNVDGAPVSISFGGGMYNYGSSPTVMNCTFSENHADLGGGMYNHGSSPAVSNCTFSENHADLGGGMYNNGTDNGTSPTVMNCTFSENDAGTGGGMFNGISSPAVTNCTFSENHAPCGGGGMWNSDSSPTVTNCIFWEDLGGEIRNEQGSNPILAYCAVQSGDTGEYVKNVGEIIVMSDDLCLGDLADNGGLTRTCALLTGSWAIDAGTADGAPDFDQRGITRLHGEGCDIGAYESVATLYVDREASGDNDGTDWDNAFVSLADALKAAEAGGEVWVAEGIYRPGSDKDGNASPDDARTKTFALRGWVALYGGFAGTESSKEEREPSAHPTLLTGDLSGNDVVAEDGTVTGNGENSYHVVTSEGLDHTAVLNGFTVTGGNADSDDWYSRGGGMYNLDSSFVVSNCTFSGNGAKEFGGGIYNEYSSPALSNCTFSKNRAYAGGGMYNYGSGPVVTNCTFSENDVRCGGGMCNYVSGPTVSNCTFSGNSAEYLGGGMYNYSFSNPTAVNCIFWDAGGGEIFSVSGSTLTLAYCVVRGGDVGDNVTLVDEIPVITDSPCLGDIADNGGPTRTCALLTGSSAIDRGVNTFLSGGVELIPDTDQRGVQRGGEPGATPCLEVGFDIGAYEAAEWFTITVSADRGGTVSADPWGVIGAWAGFTAFDMPTFVITPEESMDLTGVWLDDVPQVFTVASAEVTLEPLSADHRLEATFAPKTFTVTTSAGPGGTVSPASASVMWGRDHTVNFSPYHGYAVSGVTVDGVLKDTCDGYTFTGVEGTHTLHVTFSPDEALLDQGGIEGLDFGESGGAFGLLSGGGAGVELPAGVSGDSFAEVASMDLGGFWLDTVQSGDVQMQVARAEPGGTFLCGVSFDVEATAEGEVGLLPVSLELLVSADLLSTECLEAIADGEGTVGLAGTFLSRVAILKIVSGDAYDLFDAALDSGHEDPLEFFSVRRDGTDDFLVRVAFLIADAPAGGVPAVQAVPASGDCRFLVFDGTADGHYRDPLVAVEKGSGGSGAGCSALPLSGLALLMLPLLALLKN